MAWLIIPLSIVWFSLGLYFGTRMIVALRLQTYRNVDDLITVIEECAQHTYDGRVTPGTVLPALYKWRQELRLTPSQRRYERPRQDFT